MDKVEQYKEINKKISEVGNKSASEEEYRQLVKPLFEELEALLKSMTNEEIQRVIDEIPHSAQGVWKLKQYMK